MPQLINAMLLEIDLRADYLKDKILESIYFGGGTPSLLKEKDIGSLIEKLQIIYPISQQAEITLEVNPDDVNQENLKNWLQLGINRLSIGIQSFNNEELTWMNRTHTNTQAQIAVKEAQDAGFNNLSIDLIYGSKFQTEKSWENTLKTACDLNTQHISAYNLTIEDKTVLGLQNKKGIEPTINDALSAQFFKTMSLFLTDNGFEHYEISNFGKPNYLAIHNSNYWKQKQYLGIGPSAHSFSGNSRQWNVKNNNQYIKAINENTLFFETETLSLENKYNEYILTSLRTKWGCDMEKISSFSNTIANHFLKNVEQFVTEKKVIHLNGNYTLSLQGKLLADKIAEELFV